MLTFSDLQKREYVKQQRRKAAITLIIGLLIIAFVIGGTVLIVNEVKFEDAHVCVASHETYVPITVGKTTTIIPETVCDKWVPKK